MILWTLTTLAGTALFLLGYYLGWVTDPKALPRQITYVMKLAYEIDGQVREVKEVFHGHDRHRNP